jgi:hypothetical protein
MVGFSMPINNASPDPLAFLSGCLLDIQADLLSHLNTRVVVPSNNMSLAH